MTARYPELSGRVAIVTGAAKGIGRAIALRLAHEGMSIAIADFDRVALADTADDLQAIGVAHLPIHTDVSRPDAIDTVFRSVAEALGSVDLLVNNAAHLERRRLLDEHIELLDVQLATNIRGPYLCAQAAARVMADSGGGAIVNISSVGALRAHHRGLPYDMTKGAINTMTMAMAIDLGEYGIRVNAVAPGVTHTYRTDAIVGTPRYVATAERVPLRRFGTVDDIAAAVAFLASDESAYVTGQVIHVDGGITTQLSPPGPGALEPDGDHPPVPFTVSPERISTS